MGKMDSARVYRVGRDPNNDIVIEHSSVSRHHCELKVLQDGAVELSDLGSMNGTSVRENGQWRVVEQATVTVEHNERVLLGEIVTTVAALLLRAPKSPGEAKPVLDTPRRMPQPTAPATPAASRLIERVLKADWARLNVRRDGSKPERGDGPRNEPSICLPAMSRIDGPSATPEAPRPVPPIIVGAAPEAPPVEPEPALAATPLPLPMPAAEERIEIIVPPRTPRRFWPRGIAAWSAVMAGLVVSAGIAAAYLRFGISETASPASANASPIVAGPGEAAIVRRTPAPEKPGAAPDENGAHPAALPKPRAEGNPSSPAKAKAWHRSVEGTGAAAIAAAAATNDGGFCLAGSTETAGSGGAAWVVRLDAAGQVLWQRRPGGARRDAALAVAASADHGCVAAGYDQDATRLTILKLDARGNQAWIRAVPVGERGRATAIVELRDGGFAVAAHHKAGTDKPERAFVLRLSRAGEIKWSRYAGTGESVASDIHQTADNHFVVAGLGRASAQDKMVLWLVRVGGDGRTLWERRFAGAGAPLVGPHVQPARGGDFIVAASVRGAGSHETAIGLLRISGQGNTIWQRHHASSEPRRIGGMIVVRGGIVLAGDSGDRAARPELWLARFDSDGNPVGENRFAASAADRLAAVAELKDGRLLLAGTAEFDAPSRRGAGMIFVARERH